MRKTIAFLAISTFTLAACGSSGTEGGTGEGKSADPAKAAAEVAFQFQPGQYRTAVTIDKIDIPGMPAAALEQMKSMMGKATNIEYCISADQAAKGLEVMKEQMTKGNCKFERFEASGGAVDTVMVCNNGAAGSIRTASHGTYTPTGSLIKGSGDMSGPGGKTMHIEQTVRMERIGDCAK